MIARKDRGFALLAVLLLMATIASAYLVRALGNQLGTGIDQRSQRENQQALKEARQALRAYALIEDNTPGSLPCPAPGLDGKGSAPCGSRDQSAFGRLPWYQLGMMAGRNGNGECLWYAVSGVFKNQGNVSERDADSAINPARLGSLSLKTLQSEMESSEQSGLAAVVLAPGRPLSAQANQRSFSNNLCQDGPLSAFFEERNTISNADDDPAFIAAPITDAFNDQLIGLGREDLMPALLRRSLQRLAGQPIRELIGLRITASDSGTLATLRQNGSGSTAFDQALFAQAPATPAGECPYTTETAMQAVSWLCFNQWYEHIDYAGTGSGWQLSLSLDRTDSSAFSCTLSSSSPVVSCH